jgi:hypothetical protein
MYTHTAVTDSKSAYPTSMNIQELSVQDELEKTFSEKVQISRFLEAELCEECKELFPGMEPYTHGEIPNKSQLQCY